MKTIHSTALLAALFVVLPAHAASDADVNRMTTYAALLGRAQGCGIETYTWRKGVASWMDRTFDAEIMPSMMEVFAMGFSNEMKAQRAGKTGDLCTNVRRVVMSTAWPE